jgi:hypothetical protein
MKTKLFAAALAALTLGAGLPAAAHDRNGYVDTYRGDSYREWNRSDQRGGRWRMADITVRSNGRSYVFGRDDRLFFRLMEAPYNFMPGLTYQYTDRCNRHGCVVFVYHDYSRRPIDRIFAPHLPLRSYAWSERHDFDPRHRTYGYFDHDDHRFDDQWRYDDDDRWDDGDRRWNDYRLEGGGR